MRLVFSFTIAFVFLVLGTVAGGIFGVSPGSGLAAAPIALSYGIAAALVAAAVAFVCYGKLSIRQRKWLWIPAATIAFVTAGILVRSYVSTQSSQQDYLAELRRNFPPFELSWQLSSELSSEVTSDLSRDFSSMQIDSRDHSFHIGYEDGRNCTGSFGDTSAEKSDLLGALRSIEGEVYRDPGLCAVVDLSAGNRFVYTIHEIMPPPNIGSMELTQQCLDSNPVLVAALDSIDRVYTRLRRTQQCQLILQRVCFGRGASCSC